MEAEKQELHGMAKRIKDNQVSSENLQKEIMRIVCHVYGVTRDLMIGPNRTQPLANARHAYCQLCSALDPSATLVQIGQSIGRGHCAVINSIKKCNALRETDIDFAGLFHECVEAIAESNSKDVRRIKFNTDHILRRNTQRQREMQQALTAVTIVNDFMEAWDKEMQDVIGKKANEKLTPRARGIIAAFSAVRQKATSNGF